MENILKIYSLLLKKYCIKIIKLLNSFKKNINFT